MRTIGVISDTHGLVRPGALAALRGSDVIIHAGDIGSMDVIYQLGTVATIRAIRGNMDRDYWASKLPEDEVVEVSGKHIYVLHNIHDMDLDPAAAGYDIIVSGHTHKPNIEEKNGVLYVNPGSAGPHHSKRPITIAKIEIVSTGVTANIVEIVA